MTAADEKKHCGHECVCYEHIDNLAFLKKRMGEIVCNGIISDGTSDGCKCKNDTRYQCGDGCHGECSGEVNGVPHCPHEEKMYPISESELKLLTPNIDDTMYKTTTEKMQYRAIDAIRARGRVGQAPDCFNDVSGNGECEHSSEGESWESKPICTVSGRCLHQEIVDRRPVFYQTYCDISKHDAEVAARAREEVLIHLLDESPLLDGHGQDEGKPLVALPDVMRLIDSLRSEVKK